MARLHFAGRSLLAGLFIGIMAVPAVVLLIPKYLVLVQLGLYNSYAGMIIPLLADAAGVFIMRQLNTLTSGVATPVSGSLGLEPNSP